MKINLHYTEVSCDKHAYEILVFVINCYVYIHIFANSEQLALFHVESAWQPMWSFFFYFENDCVSLQFLQVWSWHQLRKKTWEEGGSTLLVRDTKLLYVSQSQAQTFNYVFEKKISALEHCMISVVIYHWYSLQQFFEGLPAGALRWDEWSWYQSGSSGRSPLPVLHLTRGTSWPKWQNLSWRPDFGGNRLISCGVRLRDHM